MTIKKETNRSEKIDVYSTEGDYIGNALLAGWQGIYHIYGGRWEKIEVGEFGVNILGFSTKSDFDPTQIASDINHRNRRLDFLEVFPWVTGQSVPPPFSDAKEISLWATQFYKNSIEDGSSRAPRYVRDAVSAWKEDQGIAKKRGPRKKNFNLDNLDEMNLNEFKKRDPEGFKKLSEMLQEAMEQTTVNEDDSTETLVAVG